MRTRGEKSRKFVYTIFMKEKRFNIFSNKFHTIIIVCLPAHFLLVACTPVQKNYIA
jgi:hypothetical protein